VTGTPDEPSKAGCSIADISAGMVAYGQVLAALLQRGKTGKGSHIVVSMLESMVEWMGYPMYYAFDGQPAPPRAGASHATIYPYGPFPTGDGKQVMLGLQNEREWKAFCDTCLEQPELASDPRFNANSKRSAARAELYAIIVERFSHLSAEQVIERLEAAQIANAHVNDMADVYTHPQLRARQRWVEVDSPQGLLPALLPPGSSSAYEPRMDGVPGLGQHTKAVLTELGFSATEMAALAAGQANT
jgi:itaconate CoA-transferase